MSALDETWLGILGGGQLGRYLVLAARRRGVHTFVLDPSPEAPALCEADAFRIAPFDDAQALAELAARCSRVTWETESLPVEALKRLEANGTRCFPGTASLEICQDRLREKSFLAELGVATAPWTPLVTEADLAAAQEAVRSGGILKSAREGYDGKGQIRIVPGGDVRAAWERLGHVPCVLEGIVPFQCEVSVLVARDVQGGTAVHGPIENAHRDGVLEVSHYPAALSPRAAEALKELALRIATGLAHVGILAVECFEGPEGEFLVNELAPRPHNSGHVTIGTELSQFDLHLRCVLGERVLPFTTPEGRSIANLLGGLWESGEPDWSVLGSEVELELYGKVPRHGRKMGHLAFPAQCPIDALARARELKERLVRTGGRPVLIS